MPKKSHKVLMMMKAAKLGREGAGSKEQGWSRSLARKGISSLGRSWAKVETGQEQCRSRVGAGRQVGRSGAGAREGAGTGQEHAQSSSRAGGGAGQE